MHRTSLILLFTALSACAPDIQNTSGAAYLAGGTIKDPDIAAAAAQEPAPLRFPARVGILRFVQGTVSNAPAKEQEVLRAALPDGIGTITQLGKLEVALGINTHLRSTDAKNIRTLAASRHLDYVLVMDLDPHKNTAEALFMDVRTGYPHASIETTGPGRGITNTFGYRPQNPNKINRATFKLTQALARQLDVLSADLVAQAR